MNGLFNSVYSQPIELVILDPCMNSEVNQAFISTMFMPSGQTLLSTQISGPSDSASLEYGNGFDKCGLLNYSVVDGSDTLVNTLWLDMDFTSVID